MTAAKVFPGAVHGRVAAPPSKSYTHRAVIAAFLAGRTCEVRSPLDSDDTRATTELVRALGATVRRRRRAWIVSPSGRRRAGPRVVDCGESGTTLRFGVALASLQATPTVFHGRGRLPDRPVGPLVGAIRTLGGRADSSSPTRTLPLRISGPIHGGRVTVDASESSQFASALLLALPTVEPSSRVELRHRIVSAPYLLATRAVLAAYGVRSTFRGRTIRFRGGQTYRPRAFDVPGDASSAAYLWAAAAVSGGAVTVDHLDLTWPQADLRILDLLRQTGCDVEIGRSSVRVRGPTRRGFSFDFTASPDLYPLAGAIAATVPGVSRLRGAPHLAAKESDRRAETVRLARALGASVTTAPGGVTIHGVRRPRRLELSGLTDHRLTMSAAIGALAGEGPSTLRPAGSVAKSFPEFWQALGSLGAGVTVR